eukprot:9476473-Pyramimonas_sp.AAC.1
MGFRGNRKVPIPLLPRPLPGSALTRMSRRIHEGLPRGPKRGNNWRGVEIWAPCPPPNVLPFECVEG